MYDLALLSSDQGDFDLIVQDGDLLGDSGLTTAVTISLYTDRLARADDPLPETYPGAKSSRRGWWGDLARTDGRQTPIGSRLWLLNREKILPEVVNRAREYAEEALAWIDLLGGTAEVAASAERPAALKIEVKAKLPGPDQRTDNWTAFLDYSEKRLVWLKGN
jgi:phage gp46-like protein